MASTSSSSREQVDRGRVVVAGGVRAQVDGVARVGRLGEPLGERAAERGGRRIDAQPAGDARLGARQRRPPSIRHDRDPIARRERLRGQQRRDVELLCDRLRADHAGVREQRVDRHVGGREQAARRRRVGPGRHRPAAGLDHHDRLDRPGAAGDPREPPRVAERLQVEEHDVGRRVLLPELEEVVARQIGLVTRRDERRQPQAAPPCLGDRGDADRGALRGQRHAAGRGQDLRGRRDEPDLGIGVDHTQAVRPDHAHAGRPADREQLGEARAAGGAGVGEAFGQHGDAAHSRGRALAGRPEHVGRGHGQDREVGPRLRMLDDRARVAAGLDVARHGPRLGRGADDRDRGRPQDVSHGRDGRGATAVLEPRTCGGADRRGQLDEELARLGRHVHREAGLAEHADHPVIARVHVGDERLDPVAFRDTRQMGEEDGGDAAPVPSVRHLERDLGAIGRLARVLGVRDDLLRRARRGDEPDAARRLGGMLRGALKVHARRQEAQPARVLRHPGEQRAQPFQVVRAHRPYPQSRTVAEGDIDWLYGRARAHRVGRRVRAGRRSVGDRDAQPDDRQRHQEDGAVERPPLRRADVPHDQRADERPPGRAWPAACRRPSGRTRWPSPSR